MGKLKFSKPPLSIEQQIILLRDRGINIDNLDLARKKLSTIGYYRLSGYCKIYQHSNDYFASGVKFSDILTLYSFDMELRSLVSTAIEHIEVALRTSISNYMSSILGTKWYLNSDIFKNHNDHNFHRRFVRQVDKICHERQEVFIQHFFDKYVDKYPPSWMLFECMSFGTITLIFKNLANMKHKKCISNVFGYHPTLIESWMESICYIRNICAHHSRVWNRWFVLTPLLPKKIENCYDIMPRIDNSFYQQALIINLLINHLSPGLKWIFNLRKLMDAYPQVPKQEMGFDNNWREDPIWVSTEIVSMLENKIFTTELI